MVKGQERSRDVEHFFQIPKATGPALLVLSQSRTTILRAADGSLAIAE